MVLEFDPEKSARNAIERGLPFDRVNDIDWSSVIVFEDARTDYGELRLLLFGYIDGRLHAAVVTPRDDDLRVISLRRANRKEIGLYDKEIRRGSRTP